jgi:hypothetical protein
VTGAHSAGADDADAYAVIGPGCARMLQRAESDGAGDKGGFFHKRAAGKRGLHGLVGCN